MASLSRGLLLPGLRSTLTQRILPELHVFRSRLFTTSLRLRAAPRVVRTTKPSVPISPKASPLAASVAPSKYAFVKSLATKPTSTVLYEGPSHFWFYFGCWSSGIFILGWTAFTAPGVIRQPEGVPQWVGIVFGASYVLLIAIAFYLISKTPNIVNTIRIIPRNAAGQAGRTATSFQPPQMEVTVKRMLPYLEPKVLTTDLDKIVLQSRFSLPEEYVPQLKQVERKRDEATRLAELRKFDMDHIMTMPFRRAGRAFSRMFNGIKSAWTDMGFGIINVDGKNYKVDVTRGFAHDGFRTLEKILQ